MATWKEVALVEDLSVTATQVDGSGNPINPSAAGEILISDSTSAASWTNMADNTVLAGDGGVATVMTIGGSAGDAGRVDLDSSGGSAVFTVDNDAITLAKIKDDNVTIDKLAPISVSDAAHNSLEAGSMLYWDASGNPVALAAPANATKRLGSAASGSEFIPVWEDITATTTIEVTEHPAEDTERPVIFSDDSGNTGIASAATLHGDIGETAATDDFTYNSSEHRLTVKKLRVANQITGTIDSAVAVTTAVESSDTECFLTFVKANTAQDNTLHHNAGLKYNSDTQKLTVQGDLEVNGTTTTIDTANLTVKDKTILLSEGSTSITSSDESGLVIDCSSAILEDGTNENYAPRLVWKNNGGGSAATSSTLGWMMADHGDISSGDVPGQASVLRNIAPTLINQSAAPTSSSGDAVGPGAMWVYKTGTVADSRVFIQVD